MYAKRHVRQAINYARFNGVFFREFESGVIERPVFHTRPRSYGIESNEKDDKRD